jgi:hypothetical protein
MFNISYSSLLTELNNFYLKISQNLRKKLRMQSFKNLFKNPQFDPNLKISKDVTFVYQQTINFAFLIVYCTKTVIRHN